MPRPGFGWYVVKLHVNPSRLPAHLAALDEIFLTPNGKLCGPGPEAHIKTEEMAQMYVYLNERKVKARFGPRARLTVERINLAQHDKSETLQRKLGRVNRDTRHLTEKMYGEGY